MFPCNNHFCTPTVASSLHSSFGFKSSLRRGRWKTRWRSFSCWSEMLSSMNQRKQRTQLFRFLNVNTRPSRLWAGDAPIFPFLLWFVSLKAINNIPLKSFSLCDRPNFPKKWNDIRKEGEVASHFPKDWSYKSFCLENKLRERFYSWNRRCNRG